MGRRSLEFLLYIVPAFVGLASAPLLARALGPDGRGEYALALAVGAFAITLGAVGQAEVHAHDLSKESSNLRLRLSVAGFGSVAAAASALLVLHYVMGVPLLPALVTCVFIPVLALSGIWRAEHVARGTTLKVSAQNAAAAISRLGLVAVLFSFGSLGVSSALFATQFAAALGVVFLWLTVRKYSKARIYLFAAPSARAESRSAVTVLGFAALTAIVLRSDVIALQLTSTTAEVGIYAAAVGLSESALAISAAFKTRIQAALYGAERARLFLREVLVLNLLLIPTLLIGALLSPWIVELLFGAEFAASGPVLQILMFAAYFQVLMDCGTGALAVLGDRLGMLMASAIGAVAAIVGLMLLTPSAGAIGAAVASGISYGTVSAIAGIRILRAMRA